MQKSKLFIDSTCLIVLGFGILSGLSMPQVYAQNLVINEVLASNQTVDYDDFFQFEDWIEIYNSGGIQNLAGYYLSDDPDTLNKWMFPLTNAGLTTILPGGHLRVWCDNDPQQGEDHANFKISTEGETVFLVGPNGSTIIDSVTLGIQQDDISYGRSCDGCDAWQYFNVPTPEAPNSNQTLPAAALFINEFQSVNESTVFDEQFAFSPWFEVFNPNDFQVNLAHYSITLNGQTHTFNNNQPWLTTIEANGFQIFWLDDMVTMGSNHLGISPSGTGMMSLSGPSGESVDEIEWNNNLSSNTSYGRASDGAVSWIDFAVPTPRVTNSLQIIEPANVVINEAQSDNFITYQDNFDEYEDWIELYNPTSYPIDLAGYYLSDRLDAPQKWEFPVGLGDSTVIQPGGFMMLFADENGTQGWNHLNFKISSFGEPLALRSPDGFTVADSVFVPELSADRSWGRAYDAGSPWQVFNVPTPNASNGTLSVGETETDCTGMAYPNPVLGGGNVTMPFAGELYDMAGRRMLSWNFPTSIPATWPAGIYLVSRSAGCANSREVQKLIIY